MRNRKVRERWEKQAEAAKRKGKEIPAYSEAQVTTATCLFRGPSNNSHQRKAFGNNNEVIAENC
ncbi:hypothetical protein [Providencia huaxiensis]|uniref:hypothetical protein n=1 Tax=Providencia huaxiensis TaxID=2027290 RepID=UPI003D814C5B